MQRPSVPGGACAPTAATSLKLKPTGGCRIHEALQNEIFSIADLYHTVQCVLHGTERRAVHYSWSPSNNKSLITSIMETKPPLPPFTLETAIQKARLAEDAWNSRDPQRVALAYTVDSWWRNRAEFFSGRPAIIEFLKRKWAKELDYRLIKELWAFHENRISVRFQYEWHDDSGNWFRAHGNEQWEFDDNGLMRRREASINDVVIRESDRKFFWPAGPRPADHPGLTDLGL
jgi:hypothetical protein